MTTSQTASPATSSDSLHEQLVAYMDGHVPQILNAQQDDGSFGELRMLNDQYAFAPLGLVYQTPRSQYHHSPELLKAIQRGMDGLLESLDEHGRVEFFGHDGFSHGWHYYAWVTFYWQQTLMLLRGQVDESWWQRHAEAIQHTLAGHFDRLERGWDHRGRELKQGEDVPNLFVWNAVLLYRAGALWDRPQWRELSQVILKSAVAAQQPEGWWYESGPVNTYSLVTAQAVSVYYELSGDPDALAAIGRALAYHATFSYPDGTFIETVDGRQRYSGNISMMLPPTFSRLPEGQEFLRRAVKRLPEHLKNLQGISMMVSTLTHLCDEPTQPPLESVRFDAPSEVMESIQAAVARPPRFCFTACGYETVAHPSNFRIERQNLVSLWHARTGLIVGGGNSKFQPAFSCFNVNDRQGQVHYLHRNPRLEADQEHIHLAMDYGQTPVCVDLRALDTDRARLTYTCEDLQGPADMRWHVHAQIILVPALGQTLQGAHAEQTLDERTIWWTAEDHGGRLSHNGWTLQLPDDPRVNVQWPVRPYNPYRPDRKSLLDKAAIVLSIPLSPEAPRAICDLVITE